MLKQKKSLSGSPVAFFLPYIVLSFLLTIGAFFVVGLVYTFIPIPEQALEPTALVITVAVLVVMSFSVGRATSQAGWLSGSILTLIYTVIMCLFGLITGNMPWIKVPFIIITGFLIGALGGVLGINTRPKRPRRYR